MGRSYSTYSYVNSNPLSAIDPFDLNPYQPSPVTALEEAILQGNVEAVQTLAEAAGLPSDQASAALARAAANANKINHIFGKAAHNLDRLVQACGSRGKALHDILDAGAKNFSKVPNGVVKDISVTINGVQVTVRGIMINGQFNLSTAFIP